MMPALVIHNLGKSYEGKSVLSGVSLSVHECEFVSVIGPNGSGKSTLLKIIAGVRAPESGHVEINGETAPHGHFHFSKPEYRQEKLVAYMPQDHTLLPWRTVEENLLLPSEIENSRSDARKSANDLLREFGLSSVGHFYPATLSGGTRQKVALLRTALQEASLLLLDEPFASLDALTRLEAQAWLSMFVEKVSASVLLVTHDIREALFLSDTIYVLSSRPGRIKEKFSVPLPRPRLQKHLQSPEVLDLENKLFSLLLP